MRKMKNFVVIALAAMVVASCGGGSGSSGKKLASNEFLGDLPNLVYQKMQSDSIRSAKEDAATKDLKFTSESDMKKAMALSEKFKEERNATKEKFEAAVEALKPSLVGKDIPVKVAEEAGYKITSCQIADVSGITVYVEFMLEVTDVKAIKTTYGGKDIIVSWQYLDKNDEQLGSNNTAYIELSEKANGGTASTKAVIHISPNFVDFAKINFIATN